MACSRRMCMLTWAGQPRGHGTSRCGQYVEQWFTIAWYGFLPIPQPCQQLRTTAPPPQQQQSVT